MQCNDRDSRKARQVLPARLAPLGSPAVIVTCAAAANYPNFHPGPSEQLPAEVG